MVFHVLTCIATFQVFFFILVLVQAHTFKCIRKGLHCLECWAQQLKRKEKKMEGKKHTCEHKRKDQTEIYIGPRSVIGRNEVERVYSQGSPRENGLENKKKTKRGFLGFKGESCVEGGAERAQ